MIGNFVFTILFVFRARDGQKYDSCDAEFETELLRP